MQQEVWDALCWIPNLGAIVGEIFKYKCVGKVYCTATPFRPSERRHKVSSSCRFVSDNIPNEGENRTCRFLTPSQPKHNPGGTPVIIAYFILR
jgi:hypothetical protein